MVVGGQHLLQPVGAGRVGPLEADFAVLRRIARRQVHLVGAGKPALGRIDDGRQLILAQKALPFVAAVAGDRHQPVPIGSDRRAADRHPANIAAGVGVDEIQRRRAEAAEFAPEVPGVLGGQIPRRAEIGRGPGLGPDGAHGEGAVGGGVELHHRPVTGEIQLDVPGRAGLHLNALVHDLHRLPAAAVAVLARVGGVEVVDVEVFLIDREDGQAEGDLVVVAEADAGLGRLAGADDVEAGCAQGHDVAQRWDAQGPVRIVGQHGAAGGAARGRDHPVVGALGGGLGVEIGQVAGVVGRGAGGGRREAHVAGGQLVVVEHVGRNRAGVEAGRNRQRVRRLDLDPQPVQLKAGGAGDLGALYLGVDIAGEAVAADTHHVLGRPEVRLALRQLELDRQRLGAGTDGPNIGVDPAGERLG